MLSLQYWIEEQLQSVEALGPFRQLPQRAYPFSGESPRFVGYRGENAIAILAADHSRRGSRRRGLLAQVSSWMEQARIARSVGLVVQSDQQFEIRLRHPITNELENFADTGFGCSQVLPVLVGGYNAPKASLLLVQQPELHLHPRAQAELGTFLLSLYQRTVQTVVETHSEHLVLRVQRLVAEGQISPDEVKIYYVHPTPQGREVRLIRLGDDGEFLDEWPDGFFPERLEEARAILQGPAKRQLRAI